MPKLTEDQLAEYKEAFSLFDTDGSGQIDQQELEKLFQRLGKAPSKEQLKAMIAKADIDGDGQISFEEFCRMMSKKDKFVTFETELKEAFSVFDKDGNGSISAQELLKVMTELGEKISLEEIDLMINEADLDGDGQMDFNEFVRIMMY
eukprot:TRINITY_DN1935_c0_g1_i1.p2 TRINITY_DN1935_c0_g1~~TRINITY_DN1935_c0_g1_i1.p2  ORF type:complete len:148 (+),score=50.35 TRINITY_DN1935_c0_g1_i1:107-550(+)